MSPSEAKAPTEKARLERAARLMETLRELQTKVVDVTEELEKILKGERAMGDVLKELEAHYSVTWEARYGTAYLFIYTKDRPQWKRLLKSIPVEQLKARVTVYLRDNDNFYVRARHPFSLFATKVNVFTTEEVRDTDRFLDAPVIGCSHQPPCKTDQEHTQRIVADRRTR